MNHSVLFTKVLSQQGLDVKTVWNSFDVPYSYETGWPIKLPEIDFQPNTLALMHFQDFVTIQNGRCVELDILEQHYQEHAAQIVVTHWPHDLSSVYQGPINLIEFSSPNYNVPLAVRQRLSEWEDILTMPKTQIWQCLNGRKCNHRTRAVTKLQNIPNGTLSYSHGLPLTEWDYSTYRGTENDENFVRLKNLYGRTAINIVTETQYDCYPGIITEKTLMAFFANQVPIIIGHPGAVEHCRQLGFDMFDDIVDHSYDSMPDDVRVEQAIELNQHLLLNGIDMQLLRGRLDKNRIHALDGLPSWYADNFRNGIETLARRLRS